MELDYPRRSSPSPAIRKQNEELKSRYNISGFPTVLILDPNGAVLAKTGYNKNPSEWIRNVEAQLAPKVPSDFVGN